jgi:hypothetical protein
MRTKRRATVDQLRQAIDRLPRDSRIAMLQGIATNPIIVGAYTSPDGICPMLAAHRQGGRTPLIAFAEAWDAYAYRGTSRWRRPRSRRATDRELLVLRCHLEASLLEAGEIPANVPARAAGRDAVAAPRTARPASRPGDRDRREELGAQPGWAWTRIVRRLEDYEAVLAAVSAEDPALAEPGVAPESLAAARAS